MAHRAAIYTVRVHEKGRPNELVPLGDIDAQGTYLGDALGGLFSDDFRSANAEATKAVVCSSSALNGDDLRLVLYHGESGVAAQIMDPTGQLLFSQAPEHEQLVKCGALFRLPRNQTLGWWAVHVNNARSAKGLVQAEMLRRFREEFGDLRLIVEPAVRGDVLDRALEERLESVTLAKYGRSPDFADADKWIREDSHAKIELHIKARERGKRLISDLARRARRGDSDAYGQIIEFGGLEFDEAKVEVVLENGLHRTFSIQGPLGGHPFAADLRPADEDGGEPTDASIFDELARVVAEMG